ncbi:MAG TPA: hypothetical protein VFW62_00740, partial [bacterium]|nr:hypothetical protein [bacterium]
MPTALGLEYGALTRELDPELRGEGLLSLAGRQERSRPDAAIELYHEILQNPAIPASIRDRAQRRVNAQLGQGNIGDRAEVLFSRFTQEATEPTMLLAMTVAGASFRASRLVALARLTSSPSSSLLTRGAGARALAGLAGFGVEGLVFPIAGRLGNVALGREQERSGPLLGREIASSYMMLGALRAGGLATGALANPRSYLRPLTQQAGMYGGILLGHELEVRAGLRERTSASIALVDGLSTLLSFQVAGRLNRSLLGRGMENWERQIDAQSQALGQPRWRLPNPSALTLRPAEAFAGSASRSADKAESLDSARVFMTGEDGKGDSSRPRRRLTLQGLTRPSLLPATSRLPLFLHNAEYRMPNLSLKAREIEHAPNGGHIQRRVLEAVESYLRVDQDPAVLIYRDSAPFDESLKGDLRIDLARYFREHELPEDFTLTVVVPATLTATHYSKDPKGIIQMETREVFARNL